jgi:hypothetical protein
MNGREGALSLSVFHKQAHHCWLHFKVTVCAIIISTITEQHRSYKYRSGNIIGNCEKLCVLFRTTYYYLLTTYIFHHHSTLPSLPYIVSIYTTIFLGLSIFNTSQATVSNAANHIHLFLSCRAFVSPKDFTVWYLYLVGPSQSIYEMGIFGT